MSEADVIARGDRPVTRESLLSDLIALGVEQGMTLLVHASLSQLGWVCGGAQTVVLSLMDAVGDTGTLVMPTHTSGLSDPLFWHNPPVPTNWWPAVREQLPAFDPDVTPSLMMGQVAELFRTLPGCLRSQHPQYSFAAFGPHASQITSGHQFNYGLGDGSPLARIYDVDGHVLLLGIGHDRNTSLHLAEQRTDPVLNKRIQNGAPVRRDGKRQWIAIEDYELLSHDFVEIGLQFAKKPNGFWSAGNVGQGVAELMSQRQIVDFAQQWIERNR